MKTKTNSKELQVKRTDAFENLYANSVSFGATIWDLKMIFGELRQEADGTPYIEQHTSVALPWAQAKLALLFLTMNVLGFEDDQGLIKIPAAAMPTPNEKAKSDPRVMAVFNALFPETTELLAETKPSGKKSDA